MKLRTDFVTNSSSSNYVTINIKSPKLTEIMRAARVCKETGETDDDEWDDYGFDRLEIDESEQMVKLMLEISNRLPYYDGDMDQTDDGNIDRTDDEDLEHIGYPPENLGGLSESLLRLLKEVGEYDLHRKGYDLSKIRSALEKNGEDILADTESADWLYETEGHGEANLYSWFRHLSSYIAKKENLDYHPSSASLWSSFHYDKENGESAKEEYSYSTPYRKDPAEDDLDIDPDFSEDDSEFELDFSEDDSGFEFAFSEEDYEDWGIEDDLTEEEDGIAEAERNTQS